MRLRADSTTLNQTFLPCSGLDEDSSWTFTPSFDTFKCKGNEYTGKYAAGAYISTTLDTSGAHNGVVIMMTVVLIDGWNNEAFLVYADERLVYSLKGSPESFPFDSCGGPYNDLLQNATFGFNHSASSLSLRMTSSLGEDAEAASWGVCNVTVRTTTGYVDVYGNTLGAGSVGEISSLSFPCKAPAMDPNWFYTPYYITTGCAGNTYVYFGAGGYMNTVFSISQAHKGIIMTFNLAFIDSWDGETFYVEADGQVVYSAVHLVGESVYSSCSNGWFDSYTAPYFGFNHTGNLLSLVIGSTLDQSWDDECFGICGISVTPVDYYVDASGNILTNADENYTNNTIKDTYFSCESPSEDAEWTYVPSYTTISCSGSSYVGGYGKNGQINTVLSTSDSHNSVVISFNLVLIDSWDGESFVVMADNEVVYSVSHNESSSSLTDTCRNSWGDRYVNVTFGFNHSAGLLNLTFTSTLDQVSTDEAWGICNLVITLGSEYADVNGNAVGTGMGGAVGSTIFSCDSPAVDTDWSYYPYFETINCASAGYSFIGGYGAGGSLSAILSIPETHEGIVVSFKLAFIDSWDGEAFYVTADSRVVYLTSHTSTNSSSNTCQGDAGDSYKDVTFGFNHTGSHLSIEFSSFLNEAADDEAWGICNLSITLSSSPVDADGNSLSSE